MPWEQRQAVPALLLIEPHLCIGKQLLVENQVMKRLPWTKEGNQVCRGTCGSCR